MSDFWEGYVPEPQYSVNCVNHDCEKCKVAAQRQWVGLTDEEAKKAFAEHNCEISKDLAGILARAIEAKLMEKNQ